MNKKEIVEKLFGFTEATYYNWKKEKRPIVAFFEKYFTEDDLEEFLKTGEVSFLEERKITKNSSILNKMLEDIEVLKHKVELLEESRK